MATQPPVITQLEPYDGSVMKFVWTLTGSDDGAPMQFAQWADRSIQFAGTFGAGVVWEGSNNSGTLNDAQGAALSTTVASGPRQIVEISELERPRAAGVTSVVISVVARRGSAVRQ